MLAFIAAALIQAPTCSNIYACYETALSQTEKIVTVRYSDQGGAQRAEAVECGAYYMSCQRQGDARVLERTPAWTSDPQYPGQGFVSSDAARYDHYSALGGGNVLTLDRARSLSGGFTVALTFSVRDIRSSQRLLTLRDEAGKPIYAMDWRQNPGGGPYALWLSRWATTGSGPDILMEDRPWDFDSGAVVYGPRAFNVSPTPSDLFEIYLTFRRDGKAEVDMFSVSHTTRDFMISHLQDTGFPVERYPVQPEQGPWATPVYRTFKSAVIGAGDGSPTPVMQVVYFNLALTLDERLGFHSRNLFYEMNRKEGTRYLHPGMRPCNSGHFLQLTQTESYITVCGPRSGIRTTPRVQGESPEGSDDRS